METPPPIPPDNRPRRLSVGFVPTLLVPLLAMAAFAVESRSGRVGQAIQGSFVVFYVLISLICAGACAAMVGRAVEPRIKLGTAMLVFLGMIALYAGGFFVGCISMLGGL